MWPHRWQPTRLSVPEILQARILEWIAMPSSRGSSWPRDWTHIGRWVLYHLHNLACSWPPPKPGVPSLWDLMPNDLKWSWCDHNRNKVHNKCSELESFWNQPPNPSLWENRLPWNPSLCQEGWRSSKWNHIEWTVLLLLNNSKEWMTCHKDGSYSVLSEINRTLRVKG